MKKEKATFAEEMSLYDIVSKKNYKIILYTYACIHYYLIILYNQHYKFCEFFILFAVHYVRLMIPNKDETSLELWTQRNKMDQSSIVAIAMNDW